MPSRKRTRICSASGSVPAGNTRTKPGASAERSTGISLPAWRTVTAATESSAAPHRTVRAGAYPHGNVCAMFSWSCGRGNGATSKKIGSRPRSPQIGYESPPKPAPKRPCARRNCAHVCPVRSPRR